MLLLVLLCCQVKKRRQVVFAHELDLLCDADAKSLFREYADLDLTFQLPSDQMGNVENDIIASCAGLPLALRLVGALLSGNDEKLRPLVEWEVSE